MSVPVRFRPAVLRKREFKVKPIWYGQLQVGSSLHKYGPIAQRIEHFTSNETVPGLNPGWVTGEHNFVVSNLNGLLAQLVRATDS